MAVYSISDLEKLTGIKTHTIRIWEKRYNIIEPQRTPTNIRYYNDEDLKLLMNVVLLNKNGYKISHIAKMDKHEVELIVGRLTASKENNRDNIIDALTLAMIDLDEVKFNQLIDKSILEKGMEKTTIQLLFPLLDKIGVLWLAGTIKPAMENFITLLIRQKLISAIDQINPNTYKNSEKFLIYMPEGETQELSFLFIHYMMLSRGFRVINLGNHITLFDVHDAWKIHQPKFIFTMLNEAATKIDLQSYLAEIEKLFPQSQVLLSGYQAVVQNYEKPDKIKVLNSMIDLMEFLDDLKKKQTRGFREYRQMHA
jgi:DNA-binding transcriptional MerR regulator